MPSFASASHNLAAPPRATAADRAARRPAPVGTRPGPDQASCDKWRVVVKAEYSEMPGLSLTLAQAGRLWTLAPELATTVMQQLVADGFLRENKRHMFVRSDSR